MEFLAADFPLPPQTVWVDFIWGLYGVGLAVIFVLGGVVLYKKAFGRQPSLNAVLAGLVSVPALDEYKKDQDKRFIGLESQINSLRKEMREEYNHSKHQGEERRNEIQALRDQVSRLQERTETHIRKLDQIDNKLDAIWRNVSGKT